MRIVKKPAREPALVKELLEVWEKSVKATHAFLSPEGIAEIKAKVPQALKDIFLDNIEVSRYGTPEDIAAMCVYLASDESSYFTGQVVTVDGGLNAHVSTVAQFRAMASRTW